MCKLICHPQKLPGAPPYGHHGGGRGPPASLPASWTSQMLVCADSFADRVFLPLAFVQSVNTPWEFSGGPAEPGQEGQQGFPAVLGVQGLQKRDPHPPGHSQAEPETLESVRRHLPQTQENLLPVGL